MELFDSHCHIQSAGVQGGERTTHERWQKAGVKADGILARAHDAGVTHMLCVGCDVEDSELAVSFVQAHPGTWAAIGIHPHEAQRFSDKSDELARFMAQATKPKVVAVGECGLDYFYEHSPKAAQRRILEFQLELALTHQLPLVFHVREAFADFWPIFEAYHSTRQPIRGVLHSFTDTQANADRAFGHGLFVGVNGIATFTKDPQQQGLFRDLPLDSMLLETDAPFLTPHPYRGKICEPNHVRTTAEFLARLRNEPVETIAKATTQNARQLFRV